MSKIIEVLTQSGIHGGVTSPAHFTVDNTQLFVDAEYDIGHDPFEHLLTGDGGQSIFQIGDNINLLSMGISVPFPFSVFDEQFIVQVEYEDDEHTPIRFPGIGASGMVFTFENYEVPLNLFFSIADNAMNSRSFGAKVVSRDLTPLKISMLNVPDILNGEVFNVSVFLKLEHNLPLS